MTTFTTAAYIWKGINPATNQLEQGHAEPSIEQQYWVGFEYCQQERKYILNVSPSRCGNIRVLWTDHDDDLMEKIVSTESEANFLANEIQNCTCWRDLETMLELLDFKRF